MKIRIIIADDSDFIRDGMRIILSVDDEFEVVGCAENGKEAVELARTHNADVILMDIQMPVMDGIEATRIIVEENLGRVLILTTFDDFTLVNNAMKSGAKGYLIKNHTPDKLKQMIKSIYSGAGVLDEGILSMYANNSSLEGAEQFDASNFTKREQEIIQLVSKGLSNKEIAKSLFISEGTVKNYISTILEKENLSHRTALAVYYLTGKKNKEE